MEGFYDDLGVVAVVDAYFNGTIEDSVVAGDGNLVDVDVELVCQHVGNIAQESLAVDASNAYGGIEEHLAVHVPFGIEDAVAETCFEFVGYRTGTFVYLYVPFVVDIAEDVVTRDGVAAGWVDILADILFGDEDGFLLVEVLAYDDIGFVGEFFLLLLGALCRRIVFQEGHELAP